MKTKEEILDEKTEDWNLTMSSASRVIALEAMEEYADEVTSGKTLQIHARDQQIEKYKELILEQDKLIKLQESSQYFEVIEAKEVRREIIQKLKNELGI